METYQDAEGENRDETIPDLITYVEVEPAHESDANALLPAIEETKKRDCKPEILLADTLYGSDENVETAKAEGVEVITPTPKGGAKGDKIGLNEFDYDREKDSEGRCPEGQVSDDTKQTDNGTTVYFDKEKCLECSQRERCPVEINKSSARVKFDAKKVRLAKRRANEETGEFGDTYRWRAGVEATMSRYKSQTGAGQLRVRGKPAVRFAEKLKALGLNILRSAQSMSARKRLETAVI
jgi:NAD-dependent dihydropyrimidine dehydrogenase PreA subunit